jgi:hypothetical protein
MILGPLLATNFVLKGLLTWFMPNFRTGVPNHVYQYFSKAGFEVFTAVKIQVEAWFVTPHSDVVGYQRF